MLVKLENPAIVQTQPFPHCVAALHSRIKRADPGLVAMHKLPVDIHNQTAVSLVEFLKHLKKQINQEPRKAGKNSRLLSLASCFPDS